MGVGKRFAKPPRWWAKARSRRLAMVFITFATYALSGAAFATDVSVCAVTVATPELTAPSEADAPLAKRCFEHDAPGPAPLDESTPPSFKAAFEELGAPAPFIGPFPGAVDLTTIEPPTGPQVVRTLGRGVASFYGKRFHGRLTANGERFNMNAMTAAHKTLPFGTRVRVTNARNGRSVTVRINDRGPFIRGRTIDLSRGAARKLGMIGRGHARVTLDIVAR